MNKAVPVILGIVAAAGGLIFALTRKSQAAPSPYPCHDLQANNEYFFIYSGPAQTFQQALGECYDVIYTIDVWDNETGEYWPPTDPVHDVILPGSICRVVVQAPCRLCGFIPQ